MLSLLLLLGFAGGMWLDVPFVRQEKQGCGSAVVWMVLKYWTAEDVAPVSNIHQELYSQEAGGVYARDVERYLQQHGLQTFVFQGEWADLAQHVDEGRPLIVVLEQNARGVPLHYVVVAGIDTERQIVWLNDPAGRKLLPMGRVEFEKKWMDHWTLLAVPQPSKDAQSRPATPDEPGREEFKPLTPAQYGPAMDRATIAFRAGKYGDARHEVATILHSRPSDGFANDFMATLYFLDDNLDASLKYWKRLGKPRVNDIQIDPPLRINPVLLERVLALSRQTVLTSGELRGTREALERTGVFSTYQLQLEPLDDGEFDVLLRASEKNGFNMLSWLRGLPFETIHPEFFNAGSRAINIRGLARWNNSRRRAWLGVTAPVLRNPKWSYSLEFDARDEDWGADSFRKAEFQFQVHSTFRDGWTWRSGVAVSRTKTTGLKYVGGVKRRVFQLPEKRFVVDSTLSTEFGRTFQVPSPRFAKVEGGATAQWFPRARGNDYQVTTRLRFGKAFGRAPFDELFPAGLDRDREIVLRARRATRETSYVISSWDLQKKVYQGTLFGISAGPFVDNGRIASEAGSVWDAGLELRLTMLGGLRFNFSYGRDLRSKRGMGFASANPELAIEQ